MTAAYISLTYFGEFERLWKELVDLQKAFISFLSVLILSLIQVDTSDFHNERPQPGTRNREVIERLNAEKAMNNKPPGRFMSMNCPYMSSGLS